MNEPGSIVRVAAKGDGVTADGRHVAGAAPGDMLLADGTLIEGPHHAAPPCRHFSKCGGCQLQHLDETALARFVAERVGNAAEGQGLAVATLGAAHLSPPQARRRATLHAQRIGGRVVLGFREGGSHRIVDLAECPALHPALFTMVAPLRRLLAGQRGKRLAADLEMTLCDQGVDLAVKGLAVEGLEATEAMLDFARDNALARLTLDQGFGPEALWEPDPVTVTLSAVPVGLPPGAFLQATADGEAVLVGAAREWLAGAATVADLFAGLGTFAFALAGPGTRVLAAEAAREPHLACKAAAGRAQRPVHALHRDLFRNPLRTEELDRFAAVLLDPPRAGAREQVAQIAASRVERVVYVSCNPSSWARDAATLQEGGYRLAELRPVGQFRWSTHVELASLFVRQG
ncbi:RNA methyltransferase [Novosphingobium sp. PC22D]|uniref:class I SAM-dependent RNA methyltransferase n=1 Tax=Novosphingobium sp. PC22D TaxID=1962403 RepID=UPI000BF0CCF3|nr:class I SAM-dependent RNA methyltransferase [Novosphingobium sp. PC22D]PEQ10251.1 RNA methyltransferase [Novosphingobium sp. PC22D]